MQPFVTADQWRIELCGFCDIWHVRGPPHWRRRHDDPRTARRAPRRPQHGSEDARCIGRGRARKGHAPVRAEGERRTEIVVWSDMVKETARTQARRLLNLKRRQIADKSRISRGQVRE